jgi:hypothetical protein
MRPATGEERYADLVLKLLLGETVPAAALPSVDWRLLARLAERNTVLLRLAGRLAALGLQPPPAFTQAAEHERARARAALDALQRITAAGARHGVEWLVPKALQRFPDVGDDLDLLVRARTPAVDRLLLEDLAVTPRPRRLAHRLAGTTVYTTGAGLVLDIHHGSVGSVGQHTRFVTALFAERQPAAIGDTAVFVPSPEHQLVLQGLEKVAGRRSFHLCDVLYTIGTIRRGGLDWDRVTRTARTHGGAAGLCCYLHYVDAIHARLTGRELLPPETKRALGGRGWGRARFREAGFGFPALWVTGRIYARQLTLAVANHDWETVARLSLWPLAVIGANLG